MPFEVGTSCFPFLLSSGATPFLIANNLGRTARVGDSSFAGFPIPDPNPATTEMLFPNFPAGTVLTFQAVIIDPGTESTKGVSVSNAVIAEVLP